MNTLIVILFILIIVQTWNFVMYGFWDTLFDIFNWDNVVKALMTFVIFFISPFLAIAICKDVYGTSAIGILNDTDNPLFNYGILIWLLCYWGLLSIYQIIRYMNRNNNPTKIQQTAVQNGPSVARLLNHPIVLVISLISSIFGIVGFYLDYFNK